MWGGFSSSKKNEKAELVDPASPAEVRVPRREGRDRDVRDALGDVALHPPAKDANSPNSPKKGRRKLRDRA